MRIRRDTYRGISTASAALNFAKQGQVGGFWSRLKSYMYIDGALPTGPLFTGPYAGKRNVGLQFERVFRR